MTTGLDRINTATASRVGDEVYLTIIVNNVKEASLVLAPHVAATVIGALAKALLPKE